MSNYYIIYGIISIIVFASWYYMSKSFIIDNVQKSCQTGIDNSNDIFWGIIIRYFIAILIGWAIIIALYYFNKDLIFSK